MSSVPKGTIQKIDQDEMTYYAAQEIDLVLKSHVKEIRYILQMEGNVLSLEEQKNYSINPVTYTSHCKAILLYLNQKGTIPLQRLSDILEDISQGTIHIRPSTIIKWNQELYRKSQSICETILQDIQSDPMIHVDETRIKINRSLYWGHTITNEKGSFFCHDKETRRFGRRTYRIAGRV